MPVNRGARHVAREGGVREWRLNKLSAGHARSHFTASGNWAALNAQAPPGARQSAHGQGGERRRTAMKFKLDIADAGELLTASA
jgi:hypothetical protein